MVSISSCGLVIKTDRLPCPAFRPNDIGGKKPGTVGFKNYNGVQKTKQKKTTRVAQHVFMDECYGKTQIQNFYRAVV